ncbi:MAG TPA: 16S rRNA (guanine(527)-N(7))-methyltransferase RsmG [Nitrospiria bacterium]
MTGDNEPRRLVMEGASTMGISVEKTEADLLCTYLQELKTWNARINLTALKTDREIVEKHFLDSMGGLALIPAGKTGRFLDIGSGAGFPGLVIKIFRPELFFVLLEANGKKSAFLHHLAGTLKVKGLEILTQRLEKLESGKAPFDVCLSRAVDQPGALLEECRPLLSPGGSVMLYQGRPGKTGEAGFEGWRRSAHVYRLPFSKIDREIGSFTVV